MKILFVADPLESFKPYKDSTFAMMREAQRCGLGVFATEPRYMSWQSGAVVTAQTRELSLTGSLDEAWFQTTRTHANMALGDFDAVLMRKDPPFDAEYIYCTHLLSQAEREGAKVFNAPSALREHPEKLALMEFAAYAPTTLVTRSDKDIRAFHAEHQDIILKPLDGMGGMGIFRVQKDGLNLGSICETLSHNGAETIMVQKYLPAIAQGDKRVLLIDGVPVPYCLARIPQAGEVRGNLAAGGKGVAQPLNAHDQKMAETLGPILAKRGLFLVGLDIIGDKLTEINVTSPTCFQEITAQTDCNVAKIFISKLMQKL